MSDNICRKRFGAVGEMGNERLLRDCVTLRLGIETLDSLWLIPSLTPSPAVTYKMKRLMSESDIEESENSCASCRRASLLQGSTVDVCTVESETEPYIGGTLWSPLCGRGCAFRSSVVTHQVVPSP